MGLESALFKYNLMNPKEFGFRNAECGKGKNPNLLKS
jgi:hypothetical protein